MKTILTPVDFSSVTPRVVEVAADLARAVRGCVVLLHVARLPPMGTGVDLEVQNVAELTAAMARTAAEELAELKRGLEEKFVETQGLRLTGFPAADILDQAAKLPADYIVIGSHGHTALYDLILGSTTSAVIKRATCPVMVVPPLKKEKTPAAGRRAGR